MALKKCKECGCPVSTKAKICPGCGAPAPKQIKKALRIILWIIGGILGIPVIIGVILAIVSPSSQGPAAQAIHHRAKTVHRQLPMTAKHATHSTTAKIDSGAIYVGPSDPPGTLAKLKLAAQLTAKGKNCAEVTDASYVPRAQRFPGHENQPYFVKCASKHGPLGKFSGYGVYFTNADLKARRTKNQEQPISGDHALLLCRQAILGKLHYPSSADFSALSTYVSNNGTTNREVIINFTALNGLGNRIPQRGKCIVGPQGHTDVTILDR